MNVLENIQREQRMMREQMEKQGKARQSQKKLGIASLPSQVPREARCARHARRSRSDGKLQTPPGDMQEMIRASIPSKASPKAHKTSPDPPKAFPKHSPDPPRNFPIPSPSLPTNEPIKAAKSRQNARITTKSILEIPTAPKSRFQG